MRTLTAPPPREVLRPALDLQEAESKYHGQRLSDGDYHRLIESNELGVTEDGATKYLFLRDTFSEQLVEDATKLFRRMPVSESNHTRASLGRTGKGGGTALGWIDGRLLKPSRDYPLVHQYSLVWLLGAMSERIHKHLPEDWKKQVETARANGFRVLGGPHGHPDIPHLMMPDPIFSTLTVNRNVKFRSHVDGGNESLSCLTTFGEFTGYYLCLPRLRVAFDILPGDLLIADTNHEQHGSVGDRTGTRISVVAYLR
jgi:hypothetical protein